MIFASQAGLDRAKKTAAMMKKTVLGMLGDVLNGKDASGRYDYLGEAERGHILGILRDTGVM